jgi:hypothetical protein
MFTARSEKRFGNEPHPIYGTRPVQPAKVDPRERRTEIVWRGKLILLQFGWAYDPCTWEAIEI